LSIYTPVVKPVIHETFDQGMAWAVQSFPELNHEIAPVAATSTMEPWKVIIHEYIGKILFDTSEKNVDVNTVTDEFVIMGSPVIQNVYQLLLSSQRDQDMQTFIQIFNSTNQEFVIETLVLVDVSTCVYEVLEEEAFKEFFFTPLQKWKMAMLVAQSLQLSPPGTSGNKFFSEMRVASSQPLLAQYKK